MGNMNFIQPQPAVSSTPTPSKSSSSLPTFGDVICLAYLYILQSVNGMQTTAQLQSKQLQSNANSQAKVNDESAQITYINVPTYKVDYNTVRTKHKPKANESRGAQPAGPNKADKSFYQSYYTTQKIFKSDNIGQIQIDQTKNNQSNKMRDDLSNQMIVLRQDAQNQSTQLNSQVDIAQQSCQEGISLVSILKQLMRKVLLKN